MGCTPSPPVVISSRMEAALILASNSPTIFEMLQVCSSSAFPTCQICSAANILQSEQVEEQRLCPDGALASVQYPRTPNNSHSKRKSDLREIYWPVILSLERPAEY